MLVKTSDKAWNAEEVAIEALRLFASFTLQYRRFRTFGPDDIRVVSGSPTLWVPRQRLLIVERPVLWVG
jgi:hypothetical protein